MLATRRPERPIALPAAVLSVLALVSLASAAWSQSSEAPPRSDTVTALSQFLVCSGNAYALCYYSGPEAAPPTKLPVPALPCVLGKDGKVATCKCYAIEDGTSTNYVALPSILDPEVRKETEEACGDDGSGCLNMANEKSCADESDSDDSDSDSDSCQTAPVCGYLGDVATKTGQTLYPKGALISTFSFANAVRYPISSTPCNDEPYLRYAGCMTAGCGEAYSENGQRFTECSCPTFVGPFQFGQSNSNLCCNLGDSNVWSAADVTVSITPPE